MEEASARRTYVSAHAYIPESITRAVTAGVRTIEHGNLIDEPSARLMAERGQQATLLSEIAPAITNGTAQLQLAGGGIGTSPGSVSLTFPQAMRRDFPLVTLVSMIAPSPDWFVGVDSLNLIENGCWVTNKVVTLYGFDANWNLVFQDQQLAPRARPSPWELSARTDQPQWAPKRQSEA